MCAFRHIPARLLNLKGVEVPLPDVIYEDEAVIAYRTWRISMSGVVASLFDETIWKPGEIVKSRSLPERGDGGIYAYPDGSAYYGQVALFGKVYQHKYAGRRAPQGFRGEYAFPVMFDVPAATQARALYDKWAKYGVWINLNGNPYEPTAKPRKKSALAAA